jgi:hypothetical protein
MYGFGEPPHPFSLAQQIKFKLHQKVRPLNKIPEMVLIVFSYSVNWAKHFKEQN